MTTLKVKFKEYFQNTYANFNIEDVYHAVTQEPGSDMVVVQHGNGHTVKVRAINLYIQEPIMNNESTFKVQMIQDFHTRSHIFKKGEQYEASPLPGESFKYYVKHGEGKYSAIGAESLFKVSLKLTEKTVGELLDEVKLTKDCEDCWGYIAQETGVKRQVVKQFFFEFILGDVIIVEIARKCKLRAVSIQRMLLCWDQWVGVEDY